MKYDYATLYNKNAWNGKDIVLEMYYTDLEKHYQLLLTKTYCKPSKLNQ